MNKPARELKRSAGVSKVSPHPKKTVTGPALWQAVLHTDKILLIVLLITAVPLITGSPILRSTGKRLAFEVLGAFLLVLVLSRIPARMNKERLKHLFLAGPHLPIFLLLLWGTFSAVSSPYKIFSFIELFHLVLYATLYFACVYYLPRLEQQERVCDALLVVTAGVSLIAISNLASPNIDEVWSGWGGAPFSHRDLLGSFLMLLLPLVLGLCLIEHTPPLRKVGAQATLLLTTFALLIDRTRSAWFGELVSLFLFACLWFWSVRGRHIGPHTLSVAKFSQEKHRFFAPLLAIIFVVMIFFAVPQMTALVSKRLHTLGTLDTDSALQARFYMWHGDRRMIAERPIFGWGIGTYSLHEAEFTHLERGTNPNIQPGQWAYEQSRPMPHGNLAHSFYLQTLVNMGFPGLCLYMATLFAFFATGGRALRQAHNTARKGKLIASLSATGGFLADAATNPSYYSGPEVILFLWLLMGLGMACAVPVSDREAPLENDRKIGSQLAYTMRFVLIALVVFGLTAPLIKETDPILPASQLCTAAGGGTFTASGIDNLGRVFSGTGANKIVLASGAGDVKSVTILAKFTDGQNRTSVVRPTGFRLTGNYQALVGETYNADGTFTVNRNPNFAVQPDLLVVTVNYRDGKNNHYAVDYPIEVR